MQSTEARIVEERICCVSKRVSQMVLVPWALIRVPLAEM